MKKVRIVSSFAFSLICLLLIAPIALGSDITGATYSGIIRVSNNGTLASNVYTVGTINTQSLINAGYVNATCNNTSVRYGTTDIAYGPSVNSSYPWAFDVSSISANTSLDYNLYAGGINSMSSKIRWFPGVAGGSVADATNNTTWLSDNFSIEIKGRWDTSYSVTTDNIILRPNATGTTGNNLSRNTGSENYQCVDEEVSDGNTSYVYTNDIITGLADTYYLPNPSHPANSYITAVRIYAKAMTDDVDGAGDGWIKVGIRKTGTGDDWSATTTLTLAYTDYYKEYTCNPFTLLSWEWADLDGIEAGIWLEASIDPPGVAAGVARCTQVWLQVFYQNKKYAFNQTEAANIEVTAAGQITATINGTTPINATSIASGEKTVKVAAEEYAKTYTQSVRTNNGIIRNGGNTRYGERINSMPMGTITSVQFRLAKVGAPTGTANITLRKVSDDSLLGTIGTLDVSTLPLGDPNPAFISFSTTPVTNSALQDVRVLVEYNGGDGSNYVAIHYNAADALADAVLSYYNAGYSDVGGLDTSVIVGMTAISFRIYVDAVLQSSTDLAAAIPNNANTLYFCQNDVLPFVEYIKVWVDGVLVLHQYWQYLTSWIDQSGNGNTLTPSYRTASSDADVSAVLLSFAPVATAESDPASVGSSGIMLTTVPTAPTEWTRELTVTFPGSAIINDVLDAGGVPRGLFWFPFATLTILALSFFIDLAIP